MNDLRTDAQKMSFYLLLSLFIAVAAPSATSAQEANAAEQAGEPPEYRGLIADALSERELGHYPESRALFAKAHAIFPNARTLRGMGLSEFDARHYVEAVIHLEAALASSVRPLDEALRDEVTDVRDAALNYVGRYRFVVVPREAQLTVDDVPVVLNAEGEVLISEGAHELLVQAPGFMPLRKHLTARGGEREQLSLKLAPELAERSTNQADTATRPWFKRGWVWAVVGVVAAGAVTGAVFAARKPDQKEAPAYGGTAAVVIKAQ